MRFNYNNPNNWGRFGVSVGGTSYLMCSQYTTTNDMHTSPFCRVLITGLSAGTLTIQPQVYQNSTSYFSFGDQSPAPMATIEEIY